MNLERIADNCPECLEGPNRPHTTQDDGVSVRGAYRCAECGHTWTCSWLLSALADEPSNGAPTGDAA